MLPVQLASQQSEAPASLHLGRPLPARGREELGPCENMLPAYDLSRHDVSMHHGQSSLEYPESEIGINQTVTHERQRQERVGGTETGACAVPAGSAYLSGSEPPAQRQQKLSFQEYAESNKMGGPILQQAGRSARQFQN